MKDEFGAFSKSTEIDDTLREPDYIKKSIGLFSLRETIHETYARTRREVEDHHAAEGLKRAAGPGRMAFFMGIGAGVTAGIFLFGPASILGWVFATTIPGLIGGGIFRGVTRGWQKVGSDVDRDAQIDEMKKKRDEMASRVELAIDEMDKGLVNQPPGVRDEFRAAFQHAALKAAIRENGISSKKVLNMVANAPAEPSAPDPATVPDPDVSTDSDVTVMKKLKVRAPGSTPA